MNPSSVAPPVAIVLPWANVRSISDEISQICERYDGGCGGFKTGIGSEPF